MKRQNKVVKIKQTEFEKLNIKLKICQWENIGEHTRRLVVVEKDFNENYLSDDDMGFYIDNDIYDKPLMLAIHKPSETLDVADFCENGSYLIKYYNNQHENYVFYPGYKGRVLNGSNYYINCCGEEIKIPYDETEVIYLIELEK